MRSRAVVPLMSALIALGATSCGSDDEPSGTSGPTSAAGGSAGTGAGGGSAASGGSAGSTDGSAGTGGNGGVASGTAGTGGNAGSTTSMVPCASGGTCTADQAACEDHNECTGIKCVCTAGTVTCETFVYNLADYCTGGGGSAGASGTGGAGGGSSGTSGTGGAGGWWRPAVGTSWQWQLSGTPIDTTVDAAAYDIDLFDTDASVVADLHAMGRKVICYLDAGSWEDWRDDAASFPASVLGNDYEGWAGEKWLDIRDLATLGPILEKRLDLCRDKGFDGVEPDNIDGYTNNTGFPLTAADQLAFNQWFAGAAHARGLSVGLKNDDDQVAQLVSVFDWAMIEDCFDGAFCASFDPFAAAGKAVFMAEYTDTGVTLEGLCAEAKTRSFSAILKHRELDAYRAACPP
jgi:hypothetical protein